MTAKIYIDKGCPIASIAPETLSDGSVAWNLHFRGDNDSVPCVSEKAAENALNLIAAAIKEATGHRPLIL